MWVCSDHAYWVLIFSVPYTHCRTIKSLWPELFTVCRNCFSKAVCNMAWSILNTTLIYCSNPISNYSVTNYTLLQDGVNWVSSEIIECITRSILRKIPYYASYKWRRLPISSHSTTPYPILSRNSVLQSVYPKSAFFHNHVCPTIRGTI